MLDKAYSPLSEVAVEAAVVPAVKEVVVCCQGWGWEDKLCVPVFTVLLALREEKGAAAAGGVGVVVGGASEEEKCVGKLKETFDWSVDSSNWNRSKAYNYNHVHCIQTIH